jgi:arginase family enzyme
MRGNFPQIRTEERIAELAAMLRPAGGGIYTVSTGRAEQEALQRNLYRARDAGEIDDLWRASLERVAAARVVILGVPSDCGAGLVRGAAFGPQGVRSALLAREPRFAELAAAEGIVDVGDVFVIPHLLHDEMLNQTQIDACRAAIYGEAPPSAAPLPVSPLSITERVMEHLLALNPDVRIMLLGGDHSVAWPVVSALARAARAAAGEVLAIVQPDAHTDLLPERLGVKYCFATWAYHANEALGRGGRLVQVGIRASGRTRAHWEGTLGVRQFWADEIASRGGDAVITDVIAHLRAIGVTRVYVSNDIDATDAALAPSTGAPAADGLSVELVRALIARVGDAFPVVGGDVVEVAPPIGSPEESKRTTDVAACYMLETLAAMIRWPTGGRPSSERKTWRTTTLMP